jgi:hypothetical protein
MPKFCALRLRVSAVNQAFILFSCGWLAIFLAGCAAPGTLVVHQDPDAAMRMTRVDVAGDYGLFRTGDQQPLLEFSLKEGDWIGFQRVNDGTVIWLYGVSGNIRNRLEVDKSYEWRRL